MRVMTQVGTTVVMALLAAASVAAEDQVKVGDLASYAHGVKGTLYTMGDKKLVVKGFEYDGAGPDAFFLVGTEGKPGDAKEGTILPHPFSGKFFEFTDPEAPIIQGRFDGTQPDIVLTLPENLKVADLKWFKVYCRAFTVNFADISFGAAGKETSTTPGGTSTSSPSDQKKDTNDSDDLPPPLLNNNNVHSHSNRHSAHGNTPAEAYPEPEGEPESEPKSGVAHCSGTAWSLLVAVATVMAASS